MNSATHTSEPEEPRVSGSSSDGRAVSRREELEALSDEELVVRHLEGEDRAFHVLAQRYQDRLVNWLQRKVQDRELAEDLMQRTFMRVYRHLHRFDPEKKFSTWIYTIAGNLAKNVYRDRSRDPLVLFQTLTKDRDEGDRPLEWEDRAYLPDEMARRRDLRALVEEVVAELPDHHREVFVLREMEGKSYREIADITGLKIGTVKSRLNRARDRFADLIADRLEEPVAS